jgi:hypothetical protein
VHFLRLVGYNIYMVEPGLNFYGGNMKNIVLALVSISCLLILALYTYKIYALDLQRTDACSDLLYGQYYTTLEGFYRNQSLLAIRYDGGNSASFLILPDNGQVNIRCVDVISLEVD